MAECDDSGELMAYHDGELPPERRREFEMHLTACPACAAELERLRELSRLLDEVQAPAMPGHLAERLHGAVGLSRQRVIVKLCKAASLAAAALLLACAGWSHLRGEHYAPQAISPATWEMAAVTPDSDQAPSEAWETVALWTVSDLALENGR
jgi:anti-sigma factor RsiW